MMEGDVTVKDLLEELEGTETWSVHFEGLVGVQDGKFHISHSGRTFGPTPLEVRTLWGEHFEQEMGPPSQVERELREEFGPKGPWRGGA